MKQRKGYMLAKRFLCFLLIFLWVIMPIAVSSASDAKIGIVLLHGKGWTPKSAHLSGLVRDLEKEGFIVITPEMPYSKDREYDKSYEDTVSEIDKHVSELKRRGANKIFIGGHSLGANVALYYAAKTSIDGVLAIAPGHTPELQGFQAKLENSVERAKKMIGEGKGDKQGRFIDFNQGKTSTIRSTAKIYLSWFDPDGQAVMPKNTAAIKAGTALLWVIGTKDKMYERGQAYAFDKAPSSPNNKYLVVNSDHFNTPNDASGEIIKWLKTFNKKE